MPRYLNSRTAEELNALLSCGFDSSDSHTSGRFEVYSCAKFDTNDKKILHTITSQYQQFAEEKTAAQEVLNYHRQRTISQSSASGGAPNPSNNRDLNAKESYLLSAATTQSQSPASPDISRGRWGMDSPLLGGLNVEQTQKMLVYLIGTLNAAYPDYDFSNVKAHHFRRRSASSIAKFFHTLFFNVGGEQFAQRVTERLWDALDEMVGPNALTWLPELRVGDSPEIPPAPAPASIAADDGETANLNAADGTNITESIVTETIVPEKKVTETIVPEKKVTETIVTEKKVAEKTVNIEISQQPSAPPIDEQFAEEPQSAVAVVKTAAKRKRSTSRVAKQLASNQPEKQPPSFDRWDDSTEIFTYEPDDSAGNPFDDEDEGLGSLWGYHYLLFNRKFKRMVFFSIHATASLDEQVSEVATTNSDHIGCWADDLSENNNNNNNIIIINNDDATKEKSAFSADVVVTTSSSFQSCHSSTVTPLPVLGSQQIKYSPPPLPPSNRPSAEV